MKKDKDRSHQRALAHFLEAYLDIDMEPKHKIMICQEQDGFEEKEEKGEVGDHPDKVKNKK